MPGAWRRRQVESVAIDRVLWYVWCCTLFLQAASFLVVELQEQKERKRKEKMGWDEEYMVSNWTLTDHHKLMFVVRKEQLKKLPRGCDIFRAIPTLTILLEMSICLKLSSGAKNLNVKERRTSQ